MSGVAWLSERGFVFETVLSGMRGFELLLFANPSTGERAIYWRRSGRITAKSVERLRGLIRVPADILVVEFSGSVDVDEDADRMLRSMFRLVKYFSGAVRARPALRLKLGDRIEVVDAAGGSIVLKQMRPTEKSRLLVVRLRGDTLELLVDKAARLEEHVSDASASEEDTMVAIISCTENSPRLHIIYPRILSQE